MQSYCLVVVIGESGDSGGKRRKAWRRAGAPANVLTVHSHRALVSHPRGRRRKAGRRAGALANVLTVYRYGALAGSKHVCEEPEATPFTLWAAGSLQDSRKKDRGRSKMTKIAKCYRSFDDTRRPTCRKFAAGLCRLCSQADLRYRARREEAMEVRRARNRASAARSRVRRNRRWDDLVAKNSILLLPLFLFSERNCFKWTNE